MKRLSLLCLISVLALAVMGFGFAKWSDTVNISAAAETGELDWGFVSGSFMQQDNGSDMTCDDGLINVRQVAEGKDVGNTTGVFSDRDADGTLDTLTVTVNNAYPCYYNEMSAKVMNYGTIPVKIQYAVLNWMNTQVTLEDGVVYYFCKDGSVVKDAGQTLPLPNAVMEFCWMNNAGAQQHPGVRLEESFELHVVQPADQSTTYTFSIGLEAIQWNESPI